MLKIYKIINFFVGCSFGFSKTIGEILHIPFQLVLH